MGKTAVASVVPVSVKKEIRIIGMFFDFHTISFSNIYRVAMKFTANVLLPGTSWIALLLLMDLVGIVENHKSYLHKLFHLSSTYVTVR